MTKYGIIEFGVKYGETWRTEAKILVLDDPNSMQTWENIEDFFKLEIYTVGDPQRIAAQFLAEEAIRARHDLSKFQYAICHTEPYKVAWRLRVDCASDVPKINP